MPWVLDQTVNFIGSATTPGANFDVWTQVGSTKHLNRDGSGNLVATSPVFPAYLYKSSVNFARAVEITTGPYPASFTVNTLFEVFGRGQVPFTIGAGDTQTGDYSVRIRGATLALFVGNTSLGFTTFTQTAGMRYILRLELTTPSVGTTHLHGKLYDNAAPTVLLADIELDDTTSGLNSSGGTYSEGLGNEGTDYTPAGWAVTEFRNYHYDPDTTGPVVASGQVHPSGKAVSLTFTDETTPILPEWSATGVQIQYRVDSGHSWISATQLGISHISSSTNILSFGIREVIPVSYLVQAIVTAADSNITDSTLPTHNAISDQTVSITNNSTRSVPGVTDPTAETFLATRGNGRTGPDGTNVNKEAITLKRHECPYGFKDGSAKVVYQGYTDGTLANIILLGAACWIRQSALEPIVRFPITFSGNVGATIYHDTILESDPLPTEALPGAIVWTTQWYKISDSVSGLPYQMWFNVREYDGAGSESDDGTLAGTVGTLTDHTLIGGFNHDDFPPLSSGGGKSARAYGPLGIVGQVHSSYTDDPLVVFGIGDSIMVANDDFTGHPDTRYSTRGFVGRACTDQKAYIVSGAFGSGATGYTTSTTTDTFYYIHGDLASKLRKVTHAINEYGINQLNLSLDQISCWDTQRDAVSDILHQYGIFNYQTTLTPRNDLGGSQAAFNIQRALFNDRVRTQSSTLSSNKGFFDVCNGTEVNYLSNTNTAVVGAMGSLHPTGGGLTCGTQLMANDIDFTLLTNNPNPIVVTTSHSSNPLEVIIQGSGTGITISWNNVGASYYKLSRVGSDGLAQSTLISAIASPTITYNDTSPLAGNSSYEVVAVP